jgi:tol-pal system protein YbgF
MRSGMMARAIQAALLAVLLFSVTARAALFDDEEARKRIEATNQRLSQTQRQFDERIAALEAQLKSQGLVELFNQVELLKAEAARLRGQMEVLGYELAEAQKRQRDLYVDLDSRMRRIETAPAPPPVATVNPAPVGAAPAPAPISATPSQAMAAPASTFGPPPSGVPPPTVGPTTIIVPGRSVPVPVPGDAGAEQRAYDAALDLFKSGNYGGAITGFAALVKTYPRSPLAPSAQYWLGNAQFAQKDFRGAIASQRQLLAAYPDSQKVPDALLNIATSQFELGDGAASRRTLEDLIARYPQSDAANKARQRLAIR